MADASAPVLALRGVSYRYPSAALPALADLDLEVGAGELVVLAGRSGSGKSTLLRAACGLVPHFHGGEFTGELARRPVVRPASTARRSSLRVVGFVAQEPESQVVSTTVAAELGLPLELRGHSATARARAVEEVALALAIEPLLDRTDRHSLRRRAPARRDRRGAGHPPAAAAARRAHLAARPGRRAMS